MVSVLASLTHPPVESRESLLLAFDLSNSRSLRSLEIEIETTPAGLVQHSDDGLSFLGDLLSTVTSLVFSEVVIILQDNIIHDPNFHPYALFRAVRNMCEAKPFRLVFLLGKSPRDREYDREGLKGMIGAQASEGALGPLLYPPVIVSYTRTAWSL